jgi:hypothetical protein
LRTQPRDPVTHGLNVDPQLVNVGAGKPLDLPPPQFVPQERGVRCDPRTIRDTWLSEVQAA